MKIKDISNSTFIPYYSDYLQQDSSYTLVELLEISLHECIDFVREIPLGKHDYRYQADKWTIKDILQHLIDAERIFSYRALRISRGDQTALPSFEEDTYVLTAQANSRSLQALLEELSAVRQSTILLFKSMPTPRLLLKGWVAGHEHQVGAIGFVIIGHMKHHLQVYKDRYL